MKTLSILIPTIHQKNENSEEYIDLLMKQLKEKKEEIDEFFDCSIYLVENKLVNEAWNELVEKSKSDIVLILNDDIILQEDVFATLAKLERGQVYCPYFTRKDDFNSIHSHNGDNIVGFCFGMYREDWIPIPECIQLWYGDDFIYHYMNHNILWGGYIHHWESKSLGSVDNRERCNKIIEQDKLNWKSLYETINSNTNSPK